MIVGLEAAFVWNSYDQNVLNDSDNYSVGLFLETQVSRTMCRFRVAGGYQSMDFDNVGLV